MSTNRWHFHDPVTNDFWIVPINPDSMTSPFPQRQFSYGMGKLGGIERVREAIPTPMDWQFGGVIRTRSHHDQLEAWAKVPNPIRITDHLGRIFLVQLTKFLPSERRPTPRVSWRMRYTMNGLVLKELS